MAQTIGERLQQARNARGLTLEQASQATHIRQHYLEALESDQRDALPSNVQGRGFLRLYTSLLDLDTTLLLQIWDGKAPAEPEPLAPPDAQAQEDQPAGFAMDYPAESPTLPSPPVQAQATAEAAASEQGSSSQSIFRQVGEKLRDQRVALGLSLPEVERYTRLRVHYVQALEDGRLEDLPSPVQGRGMLSNYAAFLNLDEEKILLRFAEGLQARRIERIPKLEPQGVFSQRKRPARQAPLWRRFLTPDLIFGVGLAGIILFFALWTVARITALRQVETQPTPPGIVEILLTPIDRGSGTPGPSTTGISPAAATAGIENSPAAGSNATGGADTGSGTTVPDTASTAETGATPFGSGAIEVETPNVPVFADTPLVPQSSDVPAATMPAMNADPLQVYIVARQRAWLRVVTDNKVKFLGRTVPGNAYAFSGSDRIELSTGNAAGLQVFYNQNDMGVLGISGEVINLVFSTEGIATPTLAFTATPTATRLATLTPQPSPTAPATPTITPLVPE